MSWLLGHWVPLVALGGALALLWVLCAAAARQEAARQREEAAWRRREAERMRAEREAILQRSRFSVLATLGQEEEDE